MSATVNSELHREIAKFGSKNVTQCINCGNCTAVCSLTGEDAVFPRKIIRYVQLGLKDRLTASIEPWLCYYCGDCSETCPRQAEPGEIMASARRYAIASLDPTGISRLLYTSKLFTVILLLALSVLFTLVLLSGSGPMKSDTGSFFAFDDTEGFLSFEIVHDLGTGVIVVAAVAALTGFVRMVLRLSSPPRPLTGQRANRRNRPKFVTRLIPAVRAVLSELGTEKRYRDCNEEPKEPWYRSQWFIHWAIMWGFLGLGIATAIDYLWMTLGNKAPGLPDPFWYPGRLLGTLAGLLFMYGTTTAIVSRIKKPDKYSSHSLLSDWLFLWLLFLVGLSGFVVEFALYLPEGTTWGYVTLLAHVVLGMELVVLLPFTKFAHSVYRPLALLIHEMNRSAGA